MTATQIFLLIQIATKLAGVIDEEVSASSDAQVKAAWTQAKSMFNVGYEQAYPESK